MHSILIKYLDFFFSSFSGINRVMAEGRQLQAHTFMMTDDGVTRAPNVTVVNRGNGYQRLCQQKQDRM